MATSRVPITRPPTVVRQARPQGRRSRHTHGRSHGGRARPATPGSGTPLWFSHVTTGHSIAASSREMIAGMKMGLPR